jgi:VWFA-related protein
MVLSTVGVWIQPTAQTPPQTTFRTGVDVVKVNAGVTTRAGNPVTDLTAADFEIKERGKLQTIDGFKFVQIDDTNDLGPDSLREIQSEADQERETARDDVRLIVIFLDDYHVDRTRAIGIRDTLARFVRRINARDLVAIMFPVTPVTALTFSRDRDAQLRSVSAFEGRKFDFFPKNVFDERYAIASSEVQEQLRDQLTSATLKQLCTHLGGLRDGPKTLVLVSEGLGERVPRYLAQPGVPIPIPQLDADPRSLDEVAKENNTSIYPADPRGVASDDLDMRQTATDTTISRRQVAAMQEQLRSLAYQTNGRAMVNTANYAEGLHQMLGDSGSYYLLGYTSTEAKHDGLFHEIEVRVKRTGVEVRARKGYWAYTNADLTRMSAPARAGPPSEVVRALADLMAKPSEYAVQTSIAMAKGNAGKTDVTLVWEPSSSGNAGPPVPAVTTVRVTATTSGGAPEFRGVAGHDPRTQSGGLVTFAAAPGETNLHLVSTAADGRVVDTEDRVVIVPDFTGTGVSLSTPLVFRARTARDIQRIKAMAGSVPTPVREFHRAERLVVRFYVYSPGGTTPVVNMRLLNARGGPAADLPPATATPDGGFETEFPLAPFGSGEYLIEIEATTGSEHARALVAVRISG